MTRGKNTGITTRHQAHCSSRVDGQCDCSPRYQAEAYDKATARRLRKTFTTISAARLWRQDAIVALRRGELTTDRGPTLNDACDQWLDGARAGTVANRSGDPYKPAAVRGYEKDLRLRVLPMLGHLRVGEIRVRDVQRLVDQLVQEGHAPATVMGAVTPLRAIYRRLSSRGVVHANPTRGIELPAVRSAPRRFASPTEAEALLAAVTGIARAMWATALYAGLRRGELTGLRWTDVDLAEGVLRVRRGWDAVEGEIAPKSRRGRRNVPIPAVLRDVLVEHRMTAEGTSVFGTPHQIRKLATAAKSTWADASLVPLSLHDARHTYASLMIAADVNAKALSTFMGHANIAVTFDLYGHLMPGSESEAAGMLDAYLARAAGGSMQTINREAVKA
jgi:integrase